MEIHDEQGVHRCGGCDLAYDNVRCTLSLHPDRLHVQLCAQTTPLRYVRLRWAFAEDEKRRGPLRIYGDAWERGGGELEWRGIVPERCMPWFVLVSNGSDAEGQRERRITEGFDVMVRPAAMCFWQYDAAGITLWMDVRCGGDGVVLGGRVLDAATILFRAYEDCTAFEAGCRFCSEMCPDPVLPHQPVYGANNWYYAYGSSSHEDIVRDARKLTQLCAGNVNRPYMVIDDGWTIHPKNGPWDRGNERFPDMGALAKELRAMDIRPGIWVRYMADEGGACGLPEAWHLTRDGQYLDPSRPEVLAYVAETTRQLVDWGYQLIKFDCSAQDILGRRGYRVPYAVAQDGWHFADQGKTSAEIILQFYRTVQKAAGPETVLMGCATYSHLSAGILHVVRTGADVNGYSWDITRRMGVNTLAFRMMMNRTFFIVDADCVPVTEHMPWEKTEQWLRLLAMSGTPMFVSCRAEGCAGPVASALTEAYARNALQADELIPLDWMENICPERWLCQGREVRFDWYDDSIPVLFAAQSM
ncbi:MAG: alpha-galactosidase [Aristaeellaceae bacterium]